MLTQGFRETIILDLVVDHSCTVERKTHIYYFTLYDFVDLLTGNQKDKVVINTVGDPFKDTSSVSLNPIIKFTTLFGLLAMEMAISENFREFAPWVGIIFVLVAIFFVWRSFYKMRIDDTIDNIINAYKKK